MISIAQDVKALLNTMAAFKRFLDKRKLVAEKTKSLFFKENEEKQGNLKMRNKKGECASGQARPRTSRENSLLLFLRKIS